ncbi:MAG: hypothetical protein ACR2OO_08745 [Thermomicrobiales bacterium]
MSSPPAVPPRFSRPLWAAILALTLLAYLAVGGLLLAVSLAVAGRIGWSWPGAFAAAAPGSVAALWLAISALDRRDRRTAPLPAAPAVGPHAPSSAAS